MNMIILIRFHFSWWNKILLSNMLVKEKKKETLDENGKNVIFICSLFW